MAARFWRYVSEPGSIVELRTGHRAGEGLLRGASGAPEVVVDCTVPPVIG